MNEIEYVAGDRTYIRKLYKCWVDRLVGDSYELFCETEIIEYGQIVKKGSCCYSYHKGDNFISNRFYTKTLWLGDEAQKTLDQAIDEFDSFASMEAELDINLGIINGRILLRHTEDYDYEAVIKYTDDDMNKVCVIVNKGDMHWIICQTQSFYNEDILHIDTKKVNKEIYDAIMSEAIRKNDDILKIQLKFYSHTADKKDCQRFSELIGKRILPPLSVEFNKEYNVRINKSDTRLLIDSGYTILHRPWLAMGGHTHTRYTLNPHSKYGVDAARYDGKAIDFDEYLALFEEGENSESRCILADRR